MSIRVASAVWEVCPHKGDKLLLMLALADYANEEGECWPSQKSLAQRTRCTIRGVKKMIDALVALGELDIIRPGGGIVGDRYETAKYRLTKYVDWTPLPRAERRAQPTHRGLNVGTSRAERGDIEGGTPEQLRAEQAVQPNRHEEPSIEPSKEPGSLELFAIVETELPPPLNTPEILDAWEGFKEGRKKHPMTARARKDIVTDLLRFGPGKALVALRKATRRGWRDVFEPKPEDMREFAKANGANGHTRKITESDV